MKPKLAVDVGRLWLCNPLMNASGTLDLLELAAQGVSPGSLGAVVTKSITPRPRAGNPPPRLWEVAAGLLNSVGIPSPGIEAFLQEMLPRLRQLDVFRAPHAPALIVSIAGEVPSDYGALAGMLDGEPGVAAIELNLSCPNIGRGLEFARDPVLLREAVSSARAATRLPIIAKLAADVTSVAEMALIAQDSGADAISVTNSLAGMAIDIRRKRPVLGNLTGGLTGPAIKPVALRAVWEVYRAVQIPVIGMGGISTSEDAVEFLLAGARALAVGTALFFRPGVFEEIEKGLCEYLEREGFGSVTDVVGLAHRSGG